MKKVYICILSFLVLCAAFSICYFLSYRYALIKFNENANERNEEFMQNMDREQLLADSNVISSEQPEEDSLEVNSDKNEVIGADARFVVQSFDLITSSYSETEENIPAYFIGLKREEVISYLNDYMSNVSLDEYQKGLISYELISFSDEKVIVKKTYNSANIDFKYFLQVYADTIVVYYCDKKTIFEYTDICVSSLPESEQLKLNYGIEVKDDEELYGMLENYTS
ncbi:hypothetical protein [Anaeromicropila populeti]|uniref:BofC C-terminal domain-containing protein n=1 Tax=Anaeromicropila populeti TaxID=37658 RepID=A0A1I6KYC3_9FIRM|nr:hypothetical protein [Anaeromicropila populeti]SFR96219.1 hypothetical protein SAMN05661086_02897 [Anaeromicropila populeti]